MPTILTPSQELRLDVEPHRTNPVPLFDPYVDRYWTPEVGPAVIAFARLVAVEGERRQWWTAFDLSKAVGLGPSMRRLEAVIARAKNYGFVTLPRPSAIHAMSTVPHLSKRAHPRLPPRLAAELAGRAVQSGVSR